MSHPLKNNLLGDKITKAGEATKVFTEDDFDSYYVIRIRTDSDDRYFFSVRTFVKDIGLAKKFNTVRSARRSIKMIDNTNCKIEKIKRNNF